VSLRYGDDRVNADGTLGFGVYPEKRVMPIVSKLDFHQVSALGASGAVDFEDSIGARAPAFRHFQNESSSFISSYPRWTAAFAQEHFAIEGAKATGLIRMRAG